MPGTPAGTVATLLFAISLLAPVCLLVAAVLFNLITAAKK